MSYEDKIFEYLATSENLPVAFAVAEYIEKLKKQTHEDFWPLFSNKLQEILNGSNYREGWIYEPFPVNKLNSPWGRSRMHQTTMVKKKPGLQFIFGQGTRSNDFRLFMGIRWVPEEPGGHSSADYKRLHKSLGDLGLDIEEKHWVRWGYLPYAAQGQSLILRMQENPDTLCSELAATFWHLFLASHKMVQKINSSME